MAMKLVYRSFILQYCNGGYMNPEVTSSCFVCVFSSDLEVREEMPLSSANVTSEVVPVLALNEVS
jgi:hypothetical protein